MLRICADWRRKRASWRWANRAGLFYTPETKPRQQESFRDHIRIGRELNKPVIVHTRDARADTLAILREEKVTDCGGVLHCFTEDRETAGKLLDMGLYLVFRDRDVP
jgi:TatD DNase family protein